MILMRVIDRWRVLGKMRSVQGVVLREKTYVVVRTLRSECCYKYGWKLGLKQPGCTQEVASIGRMTIRDGNAWFPPRTMNHEAIVVGVTCSRQGSKATVRYDEEVENRGPEV